MQVCDFTVLVGSQDPRRLGAFYAKVLGLEQLPSEHHIVFQLPGAKLRLIQHSEVGPRSAEPQRIQLNLFVSDVRAELARLEPLGVGVVRPATQMAWGGWLVTLEDPDGNYVQLIEGS
ncbi:MAG TPA: VOC family protein [Chloroflexota bacterium]|nr:VOC family protein [Chloroflexota bacterium]